VYESGCGTLFVLVTGPVVCSCTLPRAVTALDTRTVMLGFVKWAPALSTITPGGRVADPPRAGRVRPSLQAAARGVNSRW
jgi:hypothetical protein